MPRANSQLGSLPYVGNFYIRILIADLWNPRLASPVPAGKSALDPDIKLNNRAIRVTLHLIHLAEYLILNRRLYIFVVDDVPLIITWAAITF